MKLSAYKVFLRHSHFIDLYTITLPPGKYLTSQHTSSVWWWEEESFPLWQPSADCEEYQYSVLWVRLSTAAHHSHEEYWIEFETKVHSKWNVLFLTWLWLTSPSIRLFFQQSWNLEIEITFWFQGFIISDLIHLYTIFNSYRSPTVSIYKIHFIFVKFHLKATIITSFCCGKITFCSQVRAIAA